MVPKHPHFERPASEVKKLWLCQHSYLISIASRYNLTDRSIVLSPMSIDELKPFDGTANAQDTRLY